MWNKKQNNHFHLSMRCLREKYPDLEYRGTIMNDRKFKSLSREQMKVLNDIGLLTFILKNKKRNMTSISGKVWTHKHRCVMSHVC